MLEVKGIDTYYGNIQALRDVSLRVDDGEIVTLIGANGAGKSTTLMTICGINRPRKGEILWNGEPIHELPPHEIVRLGISQVPEGRLIFPDLSVRENLDLGAFLRNDVQGIKEDMDYVFDLFPILAQRRKQTGGTLSGGEQQMLAISRALMARPKLLLLDEPSLGLAPIIIQQIFQIIQRVNANGTTVFLVEQNANQALRIAHRGYVMENGRIVTRDGAHCMGWNKRAIGICYVGGLDKDGRPADTRTDAQRTALIRLVKALRLVFPGVKQVLGHRDTSPDLNGDGVISPNEYMKACPCFDVQKEGF